MKCKHCGYEGVPDGACFCPMCAQPLYVMAGLDYTGLVTERTQGFVGREWVFRAIDDWLANPQHPRVFLLAGSAGTGKSAIAARLVRMSRNEMTVEDYPYLAQANLVFYHFCQNRFDATVQPLRFVKALSLELAREYPPFAQALLAVWKRENKIQVDQQVGTVAPGGTAIGARVEHLHIDLAPAEAFDLVVRQPLEQIYTDGFADTILLLIDGLDEAWPHSTPSGRNLVTLLGDVTDHPEDLPPKVRLLLTSRPDPRVIHTVGEPDLDLIEHAPDDVDDVQLYAHRRLDQLAEPGRSQLAKRIAKVGKGNFLYARYFLDDLPPRVEEIEDLSQLPLPKDLYAIYQEFLERELASPPLERWEARYGPLLGILAVAQGRGLTRLQLLGITGLPAPRLDSALRACKQYLTNGTQEAPFRIYHHSFRSFLLGEDGADEGAYRVYPGVASQDIADYFLKVYDGEWYKCQDEYALSYTPAHLAEAIEHTEEPLRRKEQVEKLGRILTDLGFLQVKTGRLSVHATLADLRTALPLLIEGREARARVQGLLHVIQGELHHLRHWDPERQPAQFAQQVLYRSVVSSLTDLSVLTEAHLERLRQIYLALQWSTAFRVPALECTLVGNRGTIWAVAVTPDGRRALSAANDGSVTLWEIATGLEQHILTGHTGRVRAVAVTPDGQRAVSAGADRALRIWNLNTRTQEAALTGHADEVMALAVTPDGRQVLSGSVDRTLRVWDLGRREVVHTLTGHSSEVRSIAVSSDSRRAISASADRTLKVWDLERGQEVHTLSARAGTLRAVALMPDSGTAVAAASDGTLQVWDLQSKKMVRVLEGHEGRVRSVAALEQPGWAISGGEDRLLRLWNLTTGKAVSALAGHAGTIWSVAAIPGGRQVISASDDQTLKIWNWNADTPLCAAQGHTRRVMGLAAAMHSPRLVSASQDNTLKIWDTDSGRLLHTLAGHQFGVCQVAVTPDGCHAISASSDRTLIIWSLDRGEPVHRLSGHRSQVLAVAVTPDGQRAVSASADRTLRVWDLGSGQSVCTLEGHRGKVPIVAVTSDGLHAVSGSVDGTVRVWNLAEGACVHTLEGHEGPVLAVALTSDGQRAVSASVDGHLRVWDLRDGTMIHRLDGHTGTVLAVGVSPAGDRAVSGSTDGSLLVWDLGSGHLLRTLRGHRKGVAAISVLADKVVSTSEDHTLRVWDLNAEQELACIALESGLLCLEVLPPGDLIAAGDRAGNVYCLRYADPRRHDHDV